MRRMLLVLCLAACCLAGCRDGKKGGAWGEENLGLRCSLAVEKTAWAAGGPAWVRIRLQNVSKGEIQLQVWPSLSLLPRRGESIMGYQCFFGLEGSGLRTLPLSEHVMLRLKRGETVKLRGNAAGLLWDDYRGPARSLYTIVPAGEYLLSLDLAAGSSHVRAKDVAVKIRP